jgi:hypothetical protein
MGDRWTRTRNLERIVVVGSVVTVLLTLAPAGSGAAPQAPPTPPQSAPAATELRVDDERPELRPAPARAGRAQVRAVATAVDEFSMIGVSAPDVDGAALEGTGAEPQIRVHADGAWGPWLELHLGTDHGPDGWTGEGAGRPPASDPIWVRAADGYEVLLPAEARRSGVTVHVVRDTGRPLARSVEPAAPPEDPAVAERMQQARAGQPAIRARSSWGARPPSRKLWRADNLTLSVVHHSVSTNSYSPAEVPGIIRGIQVFHMDANGWYDIAYNFVVDRYGVVWEGRGGGIGNAVIGGHAKGFNTGSTGVVTLGEFGAATPPAGMVNSVGTLIGWKLFIHGVDPGTTTVFTSKGNETYSEGTRLVMRRVVGHRDTASTACPGGFLQSRLGTIRSVADATYRDLRGPGTFASVAASLHGGANPLIGDFDGDGHDDAFLYGAGGEPDRLAWGSADGVGGHSIYVFEIEGTYEPLVADFDGDYVEDIFWYAPGPDPDRVWYGTRNRTFIRVERPVGGVYEPVVGDWDDDDMFDIIWYGPGSDPDHLWYGNANRTFSSYPIDISRTYAPVLGDYDGDGYDDVLWYGPENRPDRMWWGRPAHSLVSEAITVNGGGFRPFVGDFTGDQRDDIVWYRPGAGSDSMWQGRVERSFAKGFPLTINGTYLPLVGDFNGGGYDDVLLYGPGAQPDVLWFARGDGTFRRASVTVNGTYDASVVELGRDGRSDVLWYGPGADPDRVWLAVGG